MQLLAAPCCLCVVDERHACFVRDFECFPCCGSFSGVGWRARQSKQGVGFLVWLGKLRWCAPASEDGGVGVVAAGVGATVANPSCSWLERFLAATVPRWQRPWVWACARRERCSTPPPFAALALLCCGGCASRVCCTLAVHTLYRWCCRRAARCGLRFLTGSFNELS